MQTIELIKEFQDFINSNKDLQYEVSVEDKHLKIDYLELIKYNPEFGVELCEQPGETLKVLDKAVKDLRPDESNSIQIRFRNFDTIQNNHIRIRDVRVKDYLKFKVVTGVIKHISEIYGEVTLRKYECPACGNILNVLQERFGSIKEPTRCGCGRKGKFTELDKYSIDSQKMVIEEDFETLEGNQQPGRIDIILQY